MYIIEKIIDFGVNILIALVLISLLTLSFLAINYLLQERPRRITFEKAYNDKCLEVERLKTKDSKKEFGKQCGLCKEKKESHMYSSLIKGEYMCLCKDCWNMQEQHNEQINSD